MRQFGLLMIAVAAPPTLADGIEFSTSFLRLDTRPAEIRPTDANADGRDDLIVFFASPSRYQVWLADEAGKLSGGPVVQLNINTLGRSVAADVNGDGWPDLILSAPNESQLLVLAGDGMGGFAPTAGGPLASIDNPLAVIAPDLNQDGAADIVVAGNRTFATYINDGTGQFGLPDVVPTNYTNVGGLAAGDLRGADGVEIALLSGNSVAIYSNDSGTYSDFQVVTTNFGNGSAIAAGNADNQAPQDLIVPVSNRIGAMVIRYLTNAGVFVVTNPPAATTSASTQSVSIADINGDDREDIVFGLSQSSATRILYNTFSSGEFFTETEPSFGVFDDMTIPAVLDLDGDGRSEIVYAGIDTFALLTARQDDFGTFRGTGFYQYLNYGPNALIRMPDRAGNPDFLVYHGNTQNAIFGATIVPDLIGVQADTRAISGVNGGGTPPVVADINGDEILDLVQIVQTSGTYRIRWQFGQEEGGYGAALNRAIGAGNAFNLTVADFNSDGVDDFAVLTSLGDARVCLTQPDGTIGAPIVVPLSPTSNPGSLVAADFDRDGHTDLLCSNRSSQGRTHVAFGTGDGLFSPPLTFTGAAGVGSSSNDNFASTGDFNDDGHPDLAVAGSSQVYVQIYQTGRSFSEPILIASGSNTSGVYTGDLDADGRTDILAVFRNEAVPVRRGRDGDLEAHASFLHAGTLNDLELEDIDRDGLPDIVYAHSLGISIIYNRSAPACPGDYVRDGRLDLFDIAQFIRDFNDEIPTADFNPDGRFDFFDFARFIQAFSAGCP